LASMKVPEIALEEYCKKVSYVCGEDARIVPDQILEVVGGLANLYLEKIISLGVNRLRFETWGAFASKHIDIPGILIEIGNCAGTDTDRSKIILHAMQHSLIHKFKTLESPNIERPRLLFRPLGVFEVIDFKDSRYFLTYSDPADYKNFLITGHLK
jgi:hypothetical protein